MDINKAQSEGVEFVIMRGMYGNAKDTEFKNNYSKAKNAGLGVDVYQWGRASNAAQANGTTVNQLISWNNIKKANLCRQKLRVK